MGANKLHDHAMFKEWDELLAALAADPRLAAEQREDGELPLHGAARREAPEKVVRALLKAHPEGAAVQDKGGRTPRYYAKGEELRALLLAAEQGKPLPAPAKAQPAPPAPPKPKPAAPAKAKPAPPAPAKPKHAGLAPGSGGGARTFEATAFRAAYDAAEVPAYQDDLMGAVRKLVFGYCAAHGVREESGERLFASLQKQAFKFVDELLGEVTSVAQRLWTSPLKLEAPKPHKVELCSLLNGALRADGPAGLLPHVAVLTRAVNELCVTRRSGGVPFPPGGECWRGTGFDEAHRGFFAPGTSYRAPMFVATSFQRDVAQDFMERAWEGSGGWSKACVLWLVKVDPRGEKERAYRVKHANLVTKQAPGLPDEVEYLFAPYSAFKVVEAVWSATPNYRTPHRITLQAYTDNMDAPKGLPLAPWC